MKALTKLTVALIVAGSATTAMARDHGEMNLPTPHHQSSSTATSDHQQQKDIFDVLDAGNQK